MEVIEESPGLQRLGKAVGHAVGLLRIDNRGLKVIEARPEALRNSHMLVSSLLLNLQQVEVFIGSHFVPVRRVFHRLVLLSQEVHD